MMKRMSLFASLQSLRLQHQVFSVVVPKQTVSFLHQEESLKNIDPLILNLVGKPSQKTWNKMQNKLSFGKLSNSRHTCAYIYIVYINGFKHMKYVNNCASNCVHSCKYVDMYVNIYICIYITLTTASSYGWLWTWDGWYNNQPPGEASLTAELHQLWQTLRPEVGRVNKKINSHGGSRNPFGCWTKNRGKDFTPKMDGLFHGKAYFWMDEFGV